MKQSITSFLRVPIGVLAASLIVVGCSDSGSESTNGTPVTPTVSVPVAQNPVVEPPVQTPVVDDQPVTPPVVEQPVVEEPVVETPVVEEPPVEEPVVEEPVVEEPVDEEPVVEEPVVEEPPVEEPVVDPLAGSILGRVASFNGNAALAQVAVALSNDGEEPMATTTTDGSGNFRFDNVSPSETLRVNFDLPGFKSESFNAINLTANETEQLQPVRLISNENSGNGGLTGSVSNAIDGSPVIDATLNFRPGINKRTGDILATRMSDAGGNYEVENLPFGNLTLETIKQGLETTYSTVQVLGNIVRDEQNVAISPAVTQGETRIVLTWGETPSDLDAHLTGPGQNGAPPFMVFYAQPNVDGVQLDVDDVTSFGPETITFDASREGTFRYSVNRFSSGTPDALSNSEARVLVLQESGAIADFFVPAGEGDIWRVFDMVNGQVQPINEIIPRTGSALDFFAPDTLSDSN